MTAHRQINIALLCAVLGLYSLMAFLDGPSDHQAQADQLQELQAAIKTEAAHARFTKAVAALCGENAVGHLVDATTVQCMSKHGRKTRKVTL